MAIIETAHTLEEARICLYAYLPPAGEDEGQWLEIWHERCAKNLRLRERLEKKKTRPTGSRYAQPHHVDEEHLIEIESLFVTEHPHEPSGEALNFRPQRNQTYRMTVLWKEESRPQRWIRRTYEGVTNDGLQLESQEMVEFNGSLSFEAQYYTEDSGDETLAP